jgi:hypothetical protein
MATTIQASCFQFYSFTVSSYFIYSIEVIVHWISFVVLFIYVLLYSVCYSFHFSHKSGSVVIFHWISFVVLCISVLMYSVCYSFHSTHKSGSGISEWSTIHLFFFVHVPDKIWVQEFGTQTSRSFAILATPSPKTTHGGQEQR